MITINDRVRILAGDETDHEAVVYGIGSVSVGLRRRRWYFVRLMGGGEGAYLADDLQVVGHV